MRMTHDEYCRGIAHAKSLKGAVYLFYGDEPFFIDDGIRRLKKLFAKSVQGDTTVLTLQAEEVQLGKLLDELRTDDFFQTRSLTVLTGAQTLMKESAEVLLKYLAAPDPNSTLVLCSTKLPSSRKLTDRIDQTGIIVHCKKPWDNNVPSWIRNRVRQQGYKIDMQAAFKLHERVGSDLFRLAGELDKLYLYVGKDKPITPEAIVELVAPSRAFEVYRLTDAMFRRDVKAAMTITDKLIQHNSGIPMVLGWVVKSMRNLWRVSRNRNITAQEIGMNPYALKQLKKHANRFREQDFQSVHALLLETDRAVKTTGIDPRIPLERMVMKITTM